MAHSGWPEAGEGSGLYRDYRERPAQTHPPRRPRSVRGPFRIAGRCEWRNIRAESGPQGGIRRGVEVWAMLLHLLRRVLELACHESVWRVQESSQAGPGAEVDPLILVVRPRR